MSTDRFHKAAKDGLIEVLKEATRRDCNGRDEQGMTPTLYAAFHGHLEALRLLCGRGGDPDKADIFGNTALHLAAAQGHKPIVTFLVNFGANIYATDLDGRTAQDLAGMHDKDDILRFLDGVAAKLESTDKKKVKAMKEKAKEDAKKRLKEYTKRQLKTNQMQEKIGKRANKGHRPSMIETIKMKISGSTSNLTQVGAEKPRPSFSHIISGGTVGANNKTLSGVQRRILANKNNRLGNNEDDFKISEIEDGKQSVRVLNGIRRDSEVLYGGTLNYRRGKLDGVFNEAEAVDNGVPPPPSSGMIRSVSQPDFMHDLRGGDEGGTPEKPKEPSSIFIRPGIGSIVIRKSITNPFGAFTGLIGNEESSIGSGESYGQKHLSDDVELSDSESDEDDNPHAPLERFLTAFNLSEYLPRFIEQEIDLDTLLLLTENDFKNLNLPIGPQARLINAVNQRRAALENPGAVTDSML